MEDLQQMFSSGRGSPKGDRDIFVATIEVDEDDHDKLQAEPEYTYGSLSDKHSKEI